MKNLKIVKNSEADKFYKRNLNYSNLTFKGKSKKITDLLNRTKAKCKSILEIGCGDGKNLDQYQNILNIKNCYGVDLSKKAIKQGKKKYKNLKLLQSSSLEINRIKKNFDLVICGFFLYLLDRDEIFNQFNLIYKKINKNGYLIIEDFDPLFKHTNNSGHNKNLKTFKMDYTNFLEESGLFKLIYKLRSHTSNSFKKKFKSNDISLSLYQKIDFIDKYPKNI